MPVSVTTESVHGSAKDKIASHRGAGNIFNNERLTARKQASAYRLNQIWVSGQVFTSPKGAIFLTWRTSPYEVKSIQRERHSIRLVELEWVAWLCLYVHAYNGESSAVKSHAGATCFAE